MKYKGDATAEQSRTKRKSSRARQTSTVASTVRCWPVGWTYELNSW